MPAGSVIPSELISIAQCESGMRQFKDNGALVTNPISGAMGVFQELPSHQKMADKMGLRLSQEFDNIQYGIWLYGKYGNRPWLASKECWGNNSA